MARQRASVFGMLANVYIIQSMINWANRNVDQALTDEMRRGSPIYMPKRKKLKGYEKKSQLSTFNKNR